MTDATEKKEKKKMTQEDMMILLQSLYEKSIDGIPAVSQPIEELADQYLSKHDTVEASAKSFINYQIAKCTTSGFLTGFGGILTLPITVPANISSVLYVQMRMIACLAHMGGYEANSDQTQTLVYACLAGISIDTLIKQASIKIGTKLTTSLVKKIPGAALVKINQKVGFRLLTKFGTKGVINIGKMIPIVGAVVGGAFDFAETKTIANRAYKLFIKGDTSVLHSKNTPDDDTDIKLDDIEIPVPSENDESTS